MCGIAGYYNKSDVLFSPQEVLKSMGQMILTRGPDSHGEWASEDKKVGFSHRRLAIVDLSDAGIQPMVSQSRRYVIAFNGEVYNHKQLRDELIQDGYAHEWRGHSDTETLLAGFEYWGVIETISKAIGMFAFSLFDNQNKTITLFRDRVGEKPLYYGWQEDTFLFASELKAMKGHPSFNGRIDRNALRLLLKYSYIPAPHSIYEGIHKLLPGHYLQLDLITGKLQVKEYSSMSTIIGSTELHTFKDENEAINELEKELRKTIGLQMQADVPLGAFLSGGVDSSIIASLMQAQSEEPIKTFSIGFESEAYNEAEYAKRVAEHLGTEHYEQYVSSQEVLDVVPKLACVFDEPFADSSQIPTYLVSKMAKEQVTVALSGDAGDELFCGYNRYVLTGATWGKLSKIPTFIRKGIAKTMLIMPSTFWRGVNVCLPKRYKMARLDEKVIKAARVLAAPSIDVLYDRLVSQWDDTEKVVLGKSASNDDANLDTTSNLNCGVSRMMMMDSLTYLPDDILVKVDRAAMAVSLEGRIPFLDHNIIRLAWSLPLKYKLKNGTSKWVLRKVLDKHVPKHLIDRPKMGFGVPLAEWLRGPLKSWAEELLDESRLSREGFFNVNIIRNMWLQHLSKEKDCHNQLWSVLMFQQWYEHNHERQE